MSAIAMDSSRLELLGYKLKKLRNPVPVSFSAIFV